jgi:hypothetical protein
MRLLLAATTALALLFSQSAAHAIYYKPPPPIPHQPHGGAIGSGAAGVIGFEAFVAALVLYDIQRRWTCSGDYLRLGGPGFSEPWSPASTVKPPPPVCAQPVSYHRQRHVIRNK